MSQRASFLAHVERLESGQLREQKLEDHLQGVARRAREFAEAFSSGQWGYLAGLWHDLGKFSPEFQLYIRQTGDPEAHMEGAKAGRVDHSTAGAIWAVERLKTAGRILAYVVAGHHAGLPDYESDIYGSASLSQRLRHKELLNAARTDEIPPQILNRSLPQDRPKPSADPALWIRLLFSCLVDADFLDTEAFLEPSKAVSRGDYLQLSELLPRFLDYMHRKQAEAAKTKVNQIRSDVLARCIAKAVEPPGIYTLTVPTGGGKTLSSLGFALHHGVKHNKRRMSNVTPIPFSLKIRAGMV